MRGRGLGRGLQLNRRPGVPSLVAVPSPLAIIRDQQRDFSAWTPVASTVNADAAANYNGDDDATCDQTRSDVTVGLHGLQYLTGSNVVMGVTYYADLVLKPDGRNHILFQVAGPGHSAYAMFDLVGLTMGDSSGIDDHVIMALSNGWVFVRMIFTAGASAVHACNLFHAVGTNVGTDYGAIVGDITKGLLLDRYVLSRNA